MTVPALRGPGMAGTGLAGTGALARLAFQRDRIMLAAWIYVITALIAGNSWSLNKLYPTAAARADLAGSGGRNPALVFLYGRLSGDSLGAVSAWRYGVWAAIAAALMSVFLVVRHTRADEEAGRGELVGSAAVGRLAALTAALGVAVTANAVLTLLLFAALGFLGLPAAGSAVFVLAITTCGLAFAAVAAVTAQLAAGARTARGAAIGVLGAAYLLRAVGDGAGGPGWLTWLSPLGWTEFTRPYTADRWWVLALPLALTAAAVAAAYTLAVLRDHGAGLLPDRPGRATASAWLRGPRYLRSLFWPALGLAWRLQRGTLWGWAAGFAFTFAASGAAAKGIGSLLGGSAQLRTAFTRLGGQAGITDAYLAAIMSLAGLAAAAYATSAVLRLRAEESAERAEPLLATAAGRIRWGLSHVVVAVAGSALLLAVAGVAAGLGYGLRTGSAGTELARLLGAALVQLPATLAVAGAAVALFGLAPRACVAGAWAVLGAVVVIALFGQVLRLSGWVTGISPFSHVPKLPGAALTLRTTGTPLLWLGLAALALAAAGLAGLRRRDIG
jgi:ABC-2 type transport system permease protein